jgi:hypothetical protein
MKNKDIKNLLKDELRDAKVPDIRERTLRASENAELYPRTGTISAGRKRRFSLKLAGALAACAAVLTLILVFAVPYAVDKTAYASVEINLNSTATIELKLNKEEKVVKVKSDCDIGKLSEYKNMTVDAAVSRIVSECAETEYLHENAANDISVSVVCRNAAAADELKTRIGALIGLCCRNRGIEVEVG